MSHFYTPWKRQKTYGHISIPRENARKPMVFWRFQGV